MEQGEWEPIRISSNGPSLSRLFFADDLILFSVASMRQVQVILRCLEEFGAASGQQVSRPKSRVFFSKNVTVAEGDAISNALNIPTTANLGRYLGVPVIHDRVSKATYTELIDRIDKRLAGWKVKSLSLAGRITLAQSVLSSLPAYTRQTLLLPASVREYIDKKIRGFIWGSSDQGRKIHLVDWDTLCQPKEEGGLGLRSATRMNEAFMMKIAWRLMTEADSLWARVVRSKYLRRTDGGWQPRTEGRLSNLWRGVLKVLHHLPKGMMWNIKSGLQMRFWEDCWLQDGPPLAEFAQDLPEAARDLTVADLVLNGEWNLPFIRAFLPEALVMQLSLHPVPYEEEPDIPVWRLSPNGLFTIKSACELLREEEDIGQSHPVWKKVWRVAGPQRTRTFFWLVLHNKLLINGERRRRHLAQVDDCQICGGGPETTMHVLRDCSYARAVWSEVLQDEPDCDFFMEDSVKWALHYLADRSAVVDSSLFAVLCWKLWKNRNKWVFDEVLAPTSLLARQAEEMKQQCHLALNKVQEAMGSGGERSSRLVSWERPSPGWIALNTDGSVILASGSATLGGVLRDSEDRFMRAFSIWVADLSHMPNWPESIMALLSPGTWGYDECDFRLTLRRR
ncbi:unnamed protein product [Linum trigynum]|uniref:Reverse transcriptase zinc-binding domain-containing protein n=1 Tax=Linum trigynum TaxID=586398 RepID=A0AAV2E7A4_9ROSI